MTYITSPHEAAAITGATVAANNPDPAKAVEAVRRELAAIGDPDRYRISVTRPGVVGKAARVTIATTDGETIATAERKVTR